MTIRVCEDDFYEKVKKLGAGFVWLLYFGGIGLGIYLTIVRVEIFYAGLILIGGVLLIFEMGFWIGDLDGPLQRTNKKLHLFAWRSKEEC